MQGHGCWSGDNEQLQSEVHYDFVSSIPCCSHQRRSLGADIPIHASAQDSCRSRQEIIPEALQRNIPPHEAAQWPRYHPGILACVLSLANKSRSYKTTENFRPNWFVYSVAKIEFLKCVSNTVLRQHCINFEWPSSFLQKSSPAVVRACPSPTPNGIYEKSPPRIHFSVWSCRLSGQLEIWVIIVRADLDRLVLQSVFGVRNWRNNWLLRRTDLPEDHNP